MFNLVSFVLKFLNINFYKFMVILLRDGRNLKFGFWGFFGLKKSILGFHSREKAEIKMEIF